MTTDQLPMVSVIVPCLNVEHLLAGCLESVIACAYPRDRVELIVVDNGSRDRTVEIARRYTDLVYEVPGVTISALRNLGAAHATGEVLAFLDADCLASTHWLQEGVRSIRAEPCVCGYACDVPEDPSWIERDWFRQRDPGRHEATGLGGGNLFVRRTVFERIGGFDERLRTGEDAEFCKRARKLVKVISDDRINVLHLGNPKTLRQFVRREIWYGLGAFGSLGVEKLDLPLLGTAVFIAGGVGQLAGLAFWGAGGSPSLLGFSTALLVVLLGLTLLHRRRFVSGPGYAVRLALLYYLYYLGRSLSLFYIATGRPYYHRTKS